MNKYCSKCDKNLELSNFYKRSKSKYYLSICKSCRNKNSKEYISKNKEYVSKRNKAYRERNKEHTLQVKREFQKKYREINKFKVNALNRLRKYQKMLRTPKWVDDEHKWLIQEAYHLAQLRTKVTGIEWHVDHIIPIKGKTVSGLHVINNLQVITAKENLSKNNRY
jgi:5-methylcytosine-specific restriction endonuclease McrA